MINRFDETNNEYFNRIFHENKTVEETADGILESKRESGEISAHTNVDALRDAIINWLKTPQPRNGVTNEQN